MKTKRIFNLLVGLLILGLIGFSSCEKQEVIKIVGFVQGHVYDGVTNEPLDNVKVDWEVAGTPNTTTATAVGGYSVNNLYSGDYSITFSKENYTTIVYKVEIPVDYLSATVKGGGNKEYISSLNPSLYPLNAGLTGRIYKIENNTETTEAGIVVQLDYNRTDQNYRFFPNVYTATTDADGIYTFTNIPAAYAYISILDFTSANGEKFYGTMYSSSVDIQSGETVQMGSRNIYQNDNYLQLVNANFWIAPNYSTDKFDVNSDIVLTFNKEVNEVLTKQKNGDFILYDNLSNVVPSLVTYAGNVVTINPTAPLTSGGKYYYIEYHAYGSQLYDNVWYWYYNYEFYTL